MNGERSEQSARRKSLYEAKHPQTKHGASGGRGNVKTKKNESADSALSFVADTVQKTSQSKRTVESDVQIAKNVSKSVRDAIRDTP